MYRWTFLLGKMTSIILRDFWSLKAFLSTGFGDGLVLGIGLLPERWSIWGGKVSQCKWPSIICNLGCADRDERLCWSWWAFIFAAWMTIFLLNDEQMSTKGGRLNDYHFRYPENSHCSEFPSTLNLNLKTNPRKQTTNAKNKQKYFQHDVLSLCFFESNLKIGWPISRRRWIKAIAWFHDPLRGTEWCWRM